MNNYIDYFTNYVKVNYDINNKLVQEKYYHSLRVAKLITILAKKLNMNDSDTLLAFKIGLCHDLGRFHEAEINGKLDNRIFDHGSYSNKVLYNDSFIKYMDIKEHLLFRKAIYCHNKKDLTNNLNTREMFFSNLLRDADKIDIIGVRSNGKPLYLIDLPTNEVLECYLNNETIDINNINNKTDSTILYLSFIKDIYFNESFDLLMQANYLDKLLNIIEIDEYNNELLNNLINKIYERRGKVYVR